jgi:hypothetical protein
MIIGKRDTDKINNGYCRECGKQPVEFFLDICHEDHYIFLCGECVLALHSVSTPLSVLVNTGLDITETNDEV